MSDVTRLLDAVQAGDVKANDELLPLVYAELRHLAASKMLREPAGQTLQATALVHEAWLRLGDGTFQNRAHFFGAAAEAMRRILVERARSKRAMRHGGGLQRLDIDEVEITAPGKDDELLGVHEALDCLAAAHPEKADLVKLRYFAGLTLEESADVLGISVRTAKRHWAFARVWLFREISKQT